MPLDPFADPLPRIPVGFTGSPLDRADDVRRDSQAAAAARMHPLARWLVFDDLKPVMAGNDLLWARRSEAPRGGTEVFLGLDGDAPRFAVAGNTEEMDGEAIEARAAAMMLDGDGRSEIVAQARSLLDWHARHGFCARCGGPTEVEKAGYERVCGRCGEHHFPRTDPVVIMLVLDGDNCLLARQPRFPKGFLSALAGFVEPGETIEEAVRREIFEEAAVRVGRVRYVASQPWPFPSNLMIGAFAEATSTDIRIDTTELDEARWVSRDEVRSALAGNGPFGAPPPLAIARTLLETWARL